MGFTRSAEHSRILSHLRSQLFDGEVHWYETSVCHASGECGLGFFFAHHKLSDVAVNAICANNSICSGGGAICKVQEDRLISAVVVLDRNQAFAHVYTILRDRCDEVIDEMCTMTGLQSCGALLGVNMLAGGGTVALYSDVLSYLPGLHDNVEVLGGRMKLTE